jgi:plastocyanin
VRATTLTAVALLLSGCTVDNPLATPDTPTPAATASHTALPEPNAVMTLSAQGNGVVFSPRAVSIHYGAGARTVRWVNSDPAAPHRIQGYSAARHRVLFSAVLAAHGSGRRDTYTYRFTTPAPDTVTITDAGRGARSRGGTATVAIAP